MSSKPQRVGGPSPYQLNGVETDLIIKYKQIHNYLTVKSLLADQTVNITQSVNWVLSWRFLDDYTSNFVRV
jgi:hypothetical protein